MIIYDRIVNGISVNRWTQDIGDASYYESNWGDPSAYTITVTDTNPPSPGPTHDELVTAKWTEIRSKRDALLLTSDWTQFIDSPLNALQKQAWRVYRQALRDVPSTIAEINLFEQEPVWPVAPQS